MREFIIWLFSGLVPPQDADPKRVYRWRVTLAVITMANSVGIAGLTVLAFGMAPMLFHGFARSDTVDAIKLDVGTQITTLNAQVADSRTKQLDSKIQEARQLQCKLINAPDADKNEVAIDFANKRRHWLEDDYFNLTKRPYVIPACVELLGANAHG